MGVAGSGKTTVGLLLALRNEGKFHDADDFHPPANIAKMAAGTPLDDADRTPWLERLRSEVVDATPADGFTVLACSALRQSYREMLGIGSSGVALAYLHGETEMLASRLASRAGHYMKAGMLESQLSALEAPSADEGVTVGIEASPEEIVTAIETALGLRISA